VLLVTKEELYQLSFQLILHSGNARSLAMEAMNDAKEKNFEAAREKLKEADAAFVEAHHIQTELITKESNGEDFEIPIILIHGQDHLMMAMTLKDLAKEIIDLREELQR
jgi:PTS system cellobiose-specific IIA component